MERTVERRQRFVAGFPTKKAAERARIEALASASLHGQASARTTVGDFLARDWLPARQPRTAAAGRRHRGQLGVATWASYSDVIAAYVIPHIGHVRLQDLTAEHLDRLYDRLEAAGGRRGQPLSSKTVLNVHRLLHKALKDAVRQQRIAINVADRVQPPSAVRTRPSIWRVDQLRAFLRHVERDRLYAAWLLFATTGMRRGEVAGLAWADIDLWEATLSVSITLGVVQAKPTWKPRPKTDAGQRSMSLDPSTVRALQAHLAAQRAEQALIGSAWPRRLEDWRGQAREDLVFTWPDGTLVHPERFTVWFRRHCREAGLPPIRLHDVRHTYASAGLASAQGWHDVKIISERLGHTSIGFTLDTYAHVLPVADRQAAATLASVILDEPSEGAAG